MEIQTTSSQYENLIMPQNQAKPNFGIKDVWAHNLEAEFATIRKLIQKYSYVALDTEFPGIVVKPIGSYMTESDYNYETLRWNVDLLKIIQLGFSFFDANGATPPGPFVTWQFNFKFNLSEDMYAEDSINLLKDSSIQFEKLEKYGIDPFDFGELITTSGMVLSDNITWLTFHSIYDFGYFLKLSTNDKMPNKEAEFLGLISMYFPQVYDVKYLTKSCKNLYGGLQEVANQLKLTRVGLQHQAGSDSLLTGMMFFTIRDFYFQNQIDPVTYCGQLYGLSDCTRSSE